MHDSPLEPRLARCARAGSAGLCGAIPVAILARPELDDARGLLLMIATPTLLWAAVSASLRLERVARRPRPGWIVFGAIVGLLVLPPLVWTGVTTLPARLTGSESPLESWQAAVAALSEGLLDCSDELGALRWGVTLTVFAVGLACVHPLRSAQALAVVAVGAGYLGFRVAAATCVEAEFGSYAWLRAVLLVGLPLALTLAALRGSGLRTPRQRVLALGPACALGVACWLLSARPLVRHAFDTQQFQLLRSEPEAAQAYLLEVIERAPNGHLAGRAGRELVRLPRTPQRVALLRTLVLQRGPSGPRVWWWGQGRGAAAAILDGWEEQGDPDAIRWLCEAWLDANTNPVRVHASNLLHNLRVVAAPTLLEVFRRRSDPAERALLAGKILCRAGFLDLPGDKAVARAAGRELLAALVDRRMGDAQAVQRLADLMRRDRSYCWREFFEELLELPLTPREVRLIHVALTEAEWLVVEDTPYLRPRAVRPAGAG